MGRLTVGRGGLIRLALLALIWGSSFVWIKVGLRGFTPMQLGFLRLLLAAGVLLLICRLRGLRMPREPVVWVHFAVAATVGNVVLLYLFGVGELSIDSGLAGHPQRHDAAVDGNGGTAGTHGTRYADGSRRRPCRGSRYRSVGTRRSCVRTRWAALLCSGCSAPASPTS
jgi:hypothetical protein